jgi:hypothetical protein
MSSRATNPRRSSARRREVDPISRLDAQDRQILDVLCKNRVVTQDQLARLFPARPERTLRYRMQQLHKHGFVGRTRPYRDVGSAPNHHWPTRRADCFMRGDPPPRGGERREPNPLFVAHAAAITELYVLLNTQPPQGMQLSQFERDALARQGFKDAKGRERSITPDATVCLSSTREGWNHVAFVEVDRGTMSHAQLRGKADRYTAYAAAEAWRRRFPHLPALLFLTTADARGERFLATLSSCLDRAGRAPSQDPSAPSPPGSSSTCMHSPASRA